MSGERHQFFSTGPKGSPIGSNVLFLRLMKVSWLQVVKCGSKVLICSEKSRDKMMRVCAKTKADLITLEELQSGEILNGSLN